jgi:hypothetical protein
MGPGLTRREGNQVRPNDRGAIRNDVQRRFAALICWAVAIPGLVIPSKGFETSRGGLSPGCTCTDWGHEAMSSQSLFFRLVHAFCIGGDVCGSRSIPSKKTGALCHLFGPAQDRPRGLSKVSCNGLSSI